MLTPKRIVVLILTSLLLANCGASASYSKSTPAEPSTYARSSESYDDSGGDYGYEGDDDDDSNDSYDEPTAAAPSSMGMAPTAPGKAAPPRTPPSTPPSAIKPAPPQPAGPSPVVQEKRPMLIYRATIHLAVFEARKSIDEVEALAKSLGGYLVQRSDASIVVRVPAKTFDSALETVSKVGDELHRQVQVQDVTAEFRDMQIRLKNLQAVRTRLALLLDRAKTVEEALRVERELERVAGNIESIKGKLKFFSELIAFSTITVNFQARPAESISSDVNLPFPWLNRLGLGRLLDLN
jgi:hypothetical protein